MSPHRLDTEEAVYFYENEFYMLSNFSSFRLQWKGLDFDTSEHAYHWEKFPARPDIQAAIVKTRSAHEAFKLAEAHRDAMRPDWGEIRVESMRQILRAKVAQHDYVRRKLLETGTRYLVEDSWRDDFWGVGSARDGVNMLGRLWMEIRETLRREGVAAGMPSTRRPTEDMARRTIEAFLAERDLGDADYTCVEDGDDTSAMNKCGWAFWIRDHDTTSYVHEDLSIEWYGTRWRPEAGLEG